MNEMMIARELLSIANIIAHCKHEWKYYHGVLGYESYVCRKCGEDINDVPENERTPLPAHGRVGSRR